MQRVASSALSFLFKGSFLQFACKAPLDQKTSPNMFALTFHNTFCRCLGAPPNLVPMQASNQKVGGWPKYLLSKTGFRQQLHFL